MTTSPTNLSMLGIDEEFSDNFHCTLREVIKRGVWWYVVENQWTPTTMIIRKPIQDYLKEYEY